MKFQKDVNTYQSGISTWRSGQSLVFQKGVWDKVCISKGRKLQWLGFQNGMKVWYFKRTYKGQSLVFTKGIKGTTFRNSKGRKGQILVIQKSV